MEKVLYLNGEPCKKHQKRARNFLSVRARHFRNGAYARNLTCPAHNFVEAVGGGCR
jgi:hypothetical protein